MKIILKLVILILPASFILMFFLLLTEDDSIIGADYRQFALPQFNLEELDGSSFITSSDLGDTYIINVWASWCITCRVEHPYLMSLNKKGIPVIGLNYKDEENDALEWLSKFGNPYKKIIHDYKGTLALDFANENTFFDNASNINIACSATEIIFEWAAMAKGIPQSFSASISMES